MIYSNPLVYKVYDELFSIPPGEIICCKSDDEWTEIALTGQREVQINKPLLEVQKKLPKRHFERVHKSWVINVHHIDKVDWKNGYLRLMDNTSVPILPILKMRLYNLLNNNPVFCKTKEWFD